MLRAEIPENREKYYQETRKCRKLCRDKKRKYYMEKLKDIENYYKDREIRNFYQEGYQTKTVGFKNAKGELIIDENELEKIWESYFRELLNKNEAIEEDLQIQSNTQQPEQDNEKQPPELEEVIEVIKNLKSSKSGENGGIAAETVKYDGENLTELTCQLICKRWSEAIIYPIHKKGAKTECRN